MSFLTNEIPFFEFVVPLGIEWRQTERSNKNTGIEVVHITQKYMDHHGPCFACELMDISKMYVLNCSAVSDTFLYHTFFPRKSFLLLFLSHF